jgi:DNA mismatch endonuclease (patch repair protein)
MDVFTPKKRSEVMARIRSRETKPELALRSMLHELGYRFTVNGPRNRNLPGRPDLVLPKLHTVIFVHGCFWHGHEHCSAFRLPKSRRAWWKRKIEGNWGGRRSPTVKACLDAAKIWLCRAGVAEMA